MLLAPITLEHGEVYGKLTVLDRVHTKRGTRYRVGCTCGYSGMLLRAAQLMKGSVKGCLKCEGSHSD
jgi:hypothetical protein